MSSKYPNNPKPTAEQVRIIRESLAEQTRWALAALNRGDKAAYAKHQEEARVCEAWLAAYAN